MDGSMFIGTWWSLVPPLLAIVLALVTKEVYSSLFIGVAAGALLYTGFHPWNAFVALFDIMKNSMNLNILIFDVLLGMIIGAVVGVVVAHPAMKLNAYNGFVVGQGPAKSYLHKPSIMRHRFHQGRLYR